VADAKKKFASASDKAISAEVWEKARKDALGDRKATGPKEVNDVMYVTWLTESKRLRVAFLRTQTDGEYKFGGGGANPGIDPPPLPPVDPPPPAARPGRRPPPPVFDNVRWGTQFKAEFAVGKLVAIKSTKATTGKAELPPPPMVNPGPFPLPPPPLPVLPPPPIKKDK
jgi:hypothetical protein